MNHRYWIVPMLSLACAHEARSAGPFDGSQMLICSVADVADCGDDGDCTRGSAEDVNLPSLVRVDAKGKRIEGLSGGAPGTMAPIASVERENGRLVLQGGQAGRGWTLVISETTGKSTFAVADEDFGLLAFGACTAI